MPDLSVSDNVKCFTGRELKDYLSMLSTSWRYILEASSWWRGFWERIVEVVKRCLRKILSKSKLTYEELLTVICETNQWSIQGRCVMFTTIVLRKPSRLHIYYLVDVFQRNKIVILTKTTWIVTLYIEEYITFKH